MMKKTHLTVGITLSGIIATTLGVAITPLFLIASAIGSIFPDVDHPHGAINQKILLVHNCMSKFITYLGLAAMVYVYGPKYVDPKLIYYTVPLFIVIAISRHRSVTHSVAGLLGAALIMKFLKIRYGVDIMLPFCLGIASHIFIDMFNPQGVELLWPYKKNFSFPVNVETGGLGEKIVFYMFLLGTIYMFTGTSIDYKELLANVIHLKGGAYT